MSRQSTPRPEELRRVLAAHGSGGGPKPGPDGTTRVSLRRSDLKRRIEEEILKQEARRRGCSVPALLQDEILGRIEAPTEDEVRAAASNDESKASLDAARESIRQERIRQRRRQFLKQLRERAARQS